MFPVRNDNGIESIRRQNYRIDVDSTSIPLPLSRRSFNMLQHTPTTAPIHSIKRVGMSKSYDKSILHVAT